MSETSNKINDLDDFWPFYLEQHRSLKNQILHVFGTTLGIFCLFYAVFADRSGFIIFALLAGYSFAWIGHFFFEKNKPATFQYPLYSFLSDFRMCYSFYRGQLRQEFEKYSIDTQS